MSRAILSIVMAAVALSAPSLRADDPLAHLPADVGAVLRVAPRAQIEPQLEAFCKAAALREIATGASFETVFADLLTVAGAEIGRAIDPQSPLYMAVMFRRDERGRPTSPAPRLWLFKPTSFDDLRKSLRAGVKPEEHDAQQRDDGFEELTGPASSIFLADRHGWALLAEPGVPLAELSKSSRDHAPPTSLDPAGLKLLQSGDVALWVNFSQGWGVYEGELQQARAKSTADAQAAAQRDGLDDAQTRKAIAATEAKWAILNRVGSDVKWFGASASIGDDALSAEGFVRLADDSPLGKLVAGCRPGRLDLLDQLPARAAAYLTLRVDHEQLNGDLLARALALTDDSRDKLIPMLNTLRENGWNSSAFALWMPRDLRLGAEVVRLDRAAAPKKLASALKTLPSNAVASEEESHQGVAIETTTQPGRTPRKSKEPEPFTPWLLRLLTGETRRLRSAVIDDTAIQAQGSSPQVMRKAIDALKSSENAGTSEPLQAIRRRLPAEANAVLLLDGITIIEGTATLGMLEHPVLAWFATPLDESRGQSYLGASLTAEAIGLRMQAYLPAKQLRIGDDAEPTLKKK